MSKEKQVDLEGKPLSDRDQIDLYLHLGDVDPTTMAAMVELSEIEKELTKLLHGLQKQRQDLRRERHRLEKESDYFYPEDK